MTQPAQEGSVVDVVIVAWNSAEVIGRCLQSLHEISNVRFNVYIVDNASGDGTPALIQPWVSSQIHLQSNPANCGFSAACNQGARLGNSPFILFLNPDCRPQPEAISAMLRVLDSTTSSVAVGGKLLHENGEPQVGFCFRSLPRFIDLCFESLLINQAFPNNRWNRSYRLLNFPWDRDGEVEQPAGACFMIRRDIFEALGGFDESFFPAWFEDVDLFRRIKKQGYRVAFCAQAETVHIGGSSIAGMPAGGATEHFFKNMIRYSAKAFGPWQQRMIRLSVVVGMLVRLGAILLSRRARARVSRGIRNGAASVVRRELRMAYCNVMKEALFQ
ncbi:MAG: glycosyltransferase family 2 protein [Acidobacteriia bacterium]|nr:glycosyltransferase family 2 protein [Terriglobia bacterium]